MPGPLNHEVIGVNSAFVYCKCRYWDDATEAGNNLMLRHVYENNDTPAPDAASAPQRPTTPGPEPQMAAAQRPGPTTSTVDPNSLEERIAHLPWQKSTVANATNDYVPAAQVPVDVATWMKSMPKNKSGKSHELHYQGHQYLFTINSGNMSRYAEASK